MRKWDNNTDRKIMSSLHDLEYPFEEESWDHMNSLLNQSSSQVTNQSSRWKYIFPVTTLIIFLCSWVAPLGHEGIRQDLNRIPSKHSQVVALDNSIAPGQIGTRKQRVQVTRGISQKQPSRSSSEKSLDSSGLIRQEGSMSYKTGAENTKKQPQTGNLTDKDEALVSPDVSSNNKFSTVALKGKSILNPFPSYLAINHNFKGPLKKQISENVVTQKAATISREEKRKQRANQREIKKLLGKNYRQVRKSELGGFSILPTNYGIRAGYGANPFYSFPLDFKNGFLGGFYAQYLLGRRFRLQFDVTYHKRNLYSTVFNNNQITPAPTDFTFRLSADNLKFFELQTVLQYIASPKSTLELGASIASIKPKVSSQLTLSDPTSIDVRIFNLPSPIVDFSFGIVAGYEYNLSDRFALGIRYIGGVNNLFRKDLPGRRYGSFLENGSTFQLAAKFQFNKAKEIE